MKIYQKNKIETTGGVALREIYLFGHKIFSYKLNKFKKVMKNCKNKCDSPTQMLHKLLTENNLKIIHQVGIVISDRATIGKKCTIFQNVTLGRKGEYTPTLGDNVTIYANAVVIGNVHIGDNAVIGAGSVVLKDVPAGEVWAGNPAHFIKKI